MKRFLSNLFWELGFFITDTYTVDDFWDRTGEYAHFTELWTPFGNLMLKKHKD